MSPAAGSDHDGITLVKAANYYSEAASAAQKIRQLVQEEGYRYRDIVLICNDLGVRGSIARPRTAKPAPSRIGDASR